MVKLRARGNIPCPCGGTFGVTYEGRTDRPNGLTHSLPLCDRYIDLDVTAFLVYVREKAAN
jgi:hypothetical protein